MEEHMERETERYQGKLKQTDIWGNQKKKIQTGRHIEEQMKGETNRKTEKWRNKLKERQKDIRKN